MSPLFVRCNTVMPRGSPRATLASAGRPRTSLCPSEPQVLTSTRFSPHSHTPGLPALSTSGLVGAGRWRTWPASGSYRSSKKPREGGDSSGSGRAGHCGLWALFCAFQGGQMFPMGIYSSLLSYERCFKIAFQTDNCFVHNLDQMQFATCKPPTRQLFNLIQRPQHLGKTPLKLRGQESTRTTRKNSKGHAWAGLVTKCFRDKFPL